jgi:c-di-GMP-binding flagellar brake protein YcgR
MVFGFKGASKKRKTRGWIAVDGGYEVTYSREIVEHVLGSIKKQGILLTITHEDYQSGNTILVSFDKNKILIDKPMDWPEKKKRIRVIFKDAARLINYFTINILSVDKETIFAQFPNELYRLQRRSNFRIDVPGGSVASFQCRDDKYDGFMVNDISASGTMLCSKRQIVLPSDALIVFLKMIFPAELNSEGEVVSKGCSLSIRRGEIVRGIKNKHLKSICYGVRFNLLQNEEELLLKYVRQRELQRLRK